jgi:hypothetical protein
MEGEMGVAAEPPLSTEEKERFARFLQKNKA